MRIALFIYGRAGNKDSPAHASPSNDPSWCPPTYTQNITHSDEIWFEGITEDQRPRAARSTTARMHLNLAHLPRPDLIKLLAGHVASSAALAAANALRCATCLRKVTPRHPRPSQQPKLGQFNDRVQMDIFFGSDAAGEKQTLIGLICCATWYHLVVSLESREPTHVSSRVCSPWSTPWDFHRPPSRISTARFKDVSWTL